ncbi:MAG: flagellar assembly protein FliH [Rhodanobacter sp.]|nr:MAG: flagellar assembly protein FliH [Rhodanobacter sp.]TAM08263.1 MAG: flagellar assembly protein FliH [Rhodanobacter sp.]TAM37110.1 MAG: flagellar assembly protein FliH [Rhodanobacter sp.]
MVVAIHEGTLDFTRWELPDVGDPQPPEPAVAAGAGTQPTVREIEAIQQQARDEGRATGLAEGRAQAQKELQERVARLESVYTAAARPLLALDEQAAGDLARLAMIVARRVVAAELHLMPELIANAVQEAAKALPAATRELRVYLHPDDLALVRALEIAERDWQLVADPNLARGDCRLESERSRLDARVETRLAAAIDAVLGDAAPPLPEGLA